ncbi:hypothetical protein OX284_003075 [Flavobacterium sp. SUN046]|uniref:hypothetical protein n=1 Tax=Flavobacterium sp. SUN046 TaxID=3002440 RepID=UPI002DBE94FC|nr:hypothetical protein [Flavobacterium sp. SUN046]MEC4048399.1 hypothetical protein [Flavobacterium sp. SUN046]
MKKIILFFVFFFTSFFSEGQSFEGKITYTVSYKSKLSELSDQKWASMLGSEQDYYIKGGNYKSITNGSMLEWQLYNSKENTIYNKSKSPNGAIPIDASQQTDVITKTEIIKNAATILGYTCDEIIITTTSSVEKYFYSSKLSVDPSVFQKHKYGNWYEFVSRSKALPLKIIIDNHQFLMESTATAVKEIKLKDNFFDLPAGTVVLKSQY